ncbi:MULTISPECIES: hypothetical protein [Psychrilyobacter]|uniref:TIGR03545 family protein n=1 Tax=Psychrilyobacter piezotolerans TaxID=2293438 RepID=A0ABX9KEY5_9FUSO|nr:MULTISPECIES: hypothetical protein [Psychrilyobacter]MCS5422250.1 hypothetical protein [Psychrilyobacter sp. S5]NDI78764.1 hypothetical protein [Psychrilyobacter piezotolerans]RDE59612.1 hypothetical protein DV867_12685 [Psychrilyobacter sp. S5]REI40026.1 hypothetical protein DYH56_12685 [Psychrilyobacter piezotolerans]
MKKILGIIAGVLILIIFGTYLFRNTLIEYFGERIGSQKYGARIDIDDVDLDLFGSSLKVGRVQITDKNNTMRNIGDLQKINLDIQYKPLLKKLIVIDDATLGLVEVFTPREADGAIINKESPLPSDAGETEEKLDLSSLKIDLSGDNYRKILDDLNIKIVEEFDAERGKIEKIHTYWDNKLKGEDYKDRLKNIETKYKVIEERIKDEKNPVELLNELDKLNDLIEEIDVLAKEAESDKKQFDRDIKVIKDIQKKAFKYINSDEPFKDIAGWDEKQFQSQINLILNNYLKKYIGRNIDFFNEFNKKDETHEGETYDLWVKNTSLTFKHLNYTLKGGVKDVTSKAGITPNPIKFNLNADDKAVKGNILGELNRESETAKIKLNLSGLTVDDKMTGENKNLIIIVGSKMNLSYNMNYENKILDLDGKMILDDLKINPNELEMDPVIKEVLGEGLQEIDELIMDYTYDGTKEKLEFNTNIGTILSGLIKEVLDENIKKYKAEAKLLADKEIKKYTKKLNTEVEKVEELKKIMGESSKELKILEEKTKSNKDSESTRNLIDGLEDGLKNLFN